MKKEVLELLKKMNDKLESLDNKVDKLDNKVDKLDNKISRIEKKLDGVFDQTADLTEFKTSVIDKLNELKSVEEVTKLNCYDIAKLKATKKLEN